MRRGSLITKKEGKKLMKLIEKYKLPYDYDLNNHTMTINCALGKFVITDSLIPSHEFWFMAWVKNHVKKNKIHKLPVISGNWDKIKYLKVKLKHSKTYKKVYEVDLDRAYWENAYEQGIINDYIYFRGLWINKKTRLAAIGQLAKTTTHWKNNGFKMTKNAVINNSQKTQHLWFNVCYKVGLIMEKAANLSPGSTIFYWVDGIYVTNKKAASKIINYFHSIGYDSKIKKMKMVKVEPSCVKVYEYKSKMRPFYTTNQKLGAF